MRREIQKVGAQLLPGDQCFFRVWAPEKDGVELILNGQRYRMNGEQYGYWGLLVDGVREGDLYYFDPGIGQNLPDPASRHQPDGVHGASMVVGTDFRWADDGWTGIEAKEMIFYELHAGTFTEAGDFDGIISRLDYLTSLGITAIEIMPVADFPGSRGWGYDGVYPFAVHGVYGGVKGLKKLINEAHRSGIAVVLDVVYNHFGPDGNYMSLYGPYFSKSHKGPWGDSINFDGEYCDGVRAFFLQNLRQWLDEFHIDALRLDAVHAILDYGAVHIMEELQLEAEAIEKRTGRRKILIAELDLNDPRFIRPRERGGLGMQAQWNNEHHHAIRTVLTEENIGYYMDFGKPAQIGKSITDAYVYTGEYSRSRKHFFGRAPVDATTDQFVVFAHNHDQIGNRPLGDRLSTLLTPDALRLMAGFTILSPYLPLLFMGEEYGETAPFHYFTDHQDPELIKNIREGRKAEFSAFAGKAEFSDPQSEKTFEESKLNWDLLDQIEHHRLFRFYQYLISLRKTHRVFQNTDRSTIQLIQTGNDHIVAFRRRSEDSYLYFLFNFSRTDLFCTVEIPPDAMLLLNSNAEEWTGVRPPLKLELGKDRYILPGYAVLVLESGSPERY